MADELIFDTCLSNAPGVLPAAVDGGVFPGSPTLSTVRKSLVPASCRGSKDACADLHDDSETELPSFPVVPVFPILELDSSFASSVPGFSDLLFVNMAQHQRHYVGAFVRRRAQLQMEPYKIANGKTVYPRCTVCRGEFCAHTNGYRCPWHPSDHGTWGTCFSTSSSSTNAEAPITDPTRDAGRLRRVYSVSRSRTQ